MDAEVDHLTAATGTCGLVGCKHGSPRRDTPPTCHPPPTRAVILSVINRRKSEWTDCVFSACPLSAARSSLYLFENRIISVFMSVYKMYMLHFLIPLCFLFLMRFRFLFLQFFGLCESKRKEMWESGKALEIDGYRDRYIYR